MHHYSTCNIPLQDDNKGIFVCAKSYKNSHQTSFTEKIKVSYVPKKQIIKIYHEFYVYVKQLSGVG